MSQPAVELLQGLEESCEVVVSDSECSTHEARSYVPATHNVGWKRSWKISVAVVLMIGLLVGLFWSSPLFRKRVQGESVELGVKLEEEEASNVDEADEVTNKTTPSTKITTTTTREPGFSFFCWALLTVDKEDMSLIREQFTRRVSIFACTEWAVFSDVKTWVGDEINSIPIPTGPPATWGSVPGHPDWHMWLNTDVFLRAWHAVQHDGRYKNHDWTIKVDTDAVFFPEHLYYNLKWYFEHDGLTQYDPVYFKNCWQYKSLQGPVELLSKPAVDKFLDGIDGCTGNIKYQEWGEDWFMNKCLKQLGIRGVQDWNLLSDFNCGEEPAKLCKKNFKVAFHPFKTKKEYFECVHANEECSGKRWTVERCGGGVDDP